MNMARYGRRSLTNRFFIGLSIAAALFELMWLGFILGALIQQGVTAFSFKLFTEITPPPMMEGGLSNAILGTLVAGQLKRERHILIYGHMRV